MKLNIGCGWHSRPGVMGLDACRDSAAAIVGDARYLPVRDGCVEEIWLENVLEHFRHPEALLAEAHRVLRPGGCLHIRLPHYSSPAAHFPDHRWSCSLQVLRWWARAPQARGWRRLYRLPEFVAADVGLRPWRLRSRRLTFHRLWRWLGIEALANVYPELWEGFCISWVPARDIVADLERLEIA